MAIFLGASGAGGGTITVDDNHIFATTTERDNYFIANPSELTEGLYCVVSGQLYEYRSAIWVDITAVIQGPQGLTGADGVTSVNDDPYGVSWDGDTTQAPSRNVMYDKIQSMDSAIVSNTAKNSYPTVDANKVGFISVTQPVDLDQIESDTVTNNAKVSADGSVTSHSDVTDAGSGQIITTAERNTLNSALQTVSSDSTLTGDGTGGSPLSVTLPEVTDYATSIDPVQDAAVTQVIVDNNRGCIITTTATSNSQSIATPTDTTAGKQFTVGVSKNSTNTVTVNTTEVQVGQVVDFLWDGTAWINDPTQNTLIGSESTSWVSGCTISINADTTKYDISAGTVIIVDSYTDPTKPVVTTVPFAGVTGVTPSNILTQPITELGIDVNGNVVEQNDGFVDEEIRDYAVIGSVGHPNFTNITQVNSFTTTLNVNLASSMNDLGEVLGTINAGGNVISANGANLNLNVSAGSIFRFGVNSKSNLKNPNKLSASAVSAFPFFYTWQDGLGGFNISAPTTAVNPSSFDDGTGGVSAPNGSVANNRWSIQRVFIERSSGVNAIQYGASTYSTAADAEASLRSEPFNVNPSTRGFVLRAWLIVRGNATDLSDQSQAVFIPAGKFGDESSSGATTSTTTLQSAYNNSVANPEIQTNSTGGALSIRRGSAADTDFVFDVQNGSGSSVFNITGEGNVSLSAQPHTYGKGLGANTLTLGEATSDIVIAGNLTVNGTTTTINSQTLDVEDKNITIGDVTTPSDITADGGGITLKGSTDKTVIWQNSDDSWHFNQGISVDTGSLTVNGDVTTASNVGVGTNSTIPWGFSYGNVTLSSGGFSIASGAGTSSGFMCSNVYYDGTNWRLINNGAGYILSPQGGSEAAYFYNVNNGTAGSIAVFEENLSVSPSKVTLTTSKSEVVQLNKSTFGDASFLQMEGSTSLPVYIGVKTGDFTVQTPGSSYSDKLVVKPSGNVGVGTNNPYFSLDIKTGTNRRVSFLDNAAAPTVTGLTDGGASTGLRITGNPLLFSGDGGGGSEHMRLGSNGNLGVGTSTPNARLHVAGSELRVDNQGSATNGFIRFLNDSGSMSIGMSGAPSNDLLVFDRTNSKTAAQYIGGVGETDSWTFLTNSTGRLTIKPNGVINLSSAPTYADDAAAGAGGLVVGDIYKTSTGDLKIKL